MILEFALENIPHLDGGKISEAWKQAIERGIADCLDRPEVEKPRTITMTVQLSPEVERGVCDSVNARFSFKDGMPSRDSRAYNLGLRHRQNQTFLIFNDLSDDDVHQRTIDEGDQQS